MNISRIPPSVLGLMVLGLAACGGGDGGTTPAATPGVATTMVSGVAATGAPISNGTVELRCGNGATASSTSAANGSWSATVPTASLPCAVKVSGGTPAVTFYSLTRASGASAYVANVTPVADLALAAAVTSAVGSALDAWYTGATDAQRQQVATAIDAAVASLRTNLANAGYTLPSSAFDPFIAAISAGTAGDVYDQLLDAYRQALAAAGTTYDAARTSYTGGGSLAKNPNAPATSADVSGPLTAPGAASASAFLGNLAGTYKLLVVSNGSAGESELPTNSVRTVLIEANGTVSIRGTSKTIVYTYAQKTQSDYTQDAAGTATEVDQLRFYAANGSSIDLFISYEPAKGYLKLTPQGYSGAESTAVLGSKQNAASPGTGTGGNSPATLAARIGYAYQGNYAFACTDGNKNPSNHTVQINADGSSTLDGIAVADATHAGSIGITGAYGPTQSSSGQTSAVRQHYAIVAVRLDGSSGAPQFTAYYNADGSLDNSQFNQSTVFVGGVNYTCQGTSGTAQPARYDAGASTGAFALKQTLNCSYKTYAGQPNASSPSGSTAFSIGSDGTYTLGSLVIAPADYANAPDGSFAAVDNQTFTTLAAAGDTLQAGKGSGSARVALAAGIDRKTAIPAAGISFSNGYDIGTCTP